MLVPLSTYELIDVMRRRAGVNSQELASRIGWRIGTLDSYLHRLRGGRQAEREEMDLFARGLADDRFELSAEDVLRNFLYASAGIDPSVEDLAGFLETHFPTLEKESTPAYVFDCRGFVCWGNAALARLFELAGGPAAAEITALLHGWALVDDGGAVPRGQALADSTEGAHALFRIDADAAATVRGRMLGRKVHLLELAADPGLGISNVLGLGDGTAAPAEHASDQLLRGLRYMRALWDDFRTKDWYAPIDRSLSGVVAYREAIRVAFAPTDSRTPAQLPMDAAGSFETAAGALFFADTSPVHDPRMRVERLLPGSATMWQLWEALTK